MFIFLKKFFKLLNNIVRCGIASLVYGLLAVLSQANPTEKTLSHHQQHSQCAAQGLPCFPECPLGTEGKRSPENSCLTTSLASVFWVVAGLYVGAPRSHLFPSWISLLMASQKAHPTNQLASQHLWPFALLCKSLTFSSLLSRLGSVRGANPGSCSFWLTPSFLAPCPVATHDHGTSPVHQVLKAIKCIPCLKLFPGQGLLGVE